MLAPLLLGSLVGYALGVALLIIIDVVGARRRRRAPRCSAFTPSDGRNHVQVFAATYSYP
ncbi:MAG TPA: hypothetical protein VF576_13005 [Rubricoccaceae bacterium]